MILCQGIIKNLLSLNIHPLMLMPSFNMCKSYRMPLALNYERLDGKNIIKTKGKIIKNFDF